MTSIMLKGRKIPLLYTVYEMKTIQEDICPLDTFSFAIMGVNKENEKDRSKYGSPEHLDAVAKLIRILGNAGLEEAGEAADLTEKKILRSIRPGQLTDLLSSCMEAMSEGMASEIPDEKQDEPVDVVLEEIEKKKETYG